MGEKSLAIEMYRACAPVFYRRENVYMARVSLKDGDVHDVRFTCEDEIPPYDFVIKFVLTWLWSPAEVEGIELFQDEIYCESYKPAIGWFKKEVG